MAKPPGVMSPKKKRSITIDGHRTSLLLEPVFWSHLEREAEARKMSLSALIREIDNQRTQAHLDSLQTSAMQNLASCLRVHVVERLERELQATDR